jgi:hypothetical protein
MTNTQSERELELFQNWWSSSGHRLSTYDASWEAWQAALVGRDTKLQRCAGCGSYQFEDIPEDA